MAKQRAKYHPFPKGNPFQGLMDVTREISRVSDRMYGGGENPTAETQARSHVDAWAPTSDIFARGEDVVIRAELPGVERDDVEVTFSNGTLTLSGERKIDDDTEMVYYTKERSWGQFRRAITLPEGVDEDDITAELTDGVLEVVVRHAARAAGPARITVGGKSDGK